MMDLERHSAGEKQSQGINQVTDQLITLLDRLEFEQARNFARTGDYSGSQTILHSLLRRKTDPVILDLLARVYAQQGLLAEARSMWEKAAALDPKTPDYAEGLAFLAKTQKNASSIKRRWGRILVLLGGIALILFALLSSRVDLLRKPFEQIGLSNTNVLISVTESPGATTNILSVPAAIATLTNSLEQSNNNLLTRINVNQQTLNDISSTINLLNQPPENASIPLKLEIDVPGTTTTSTLIGVQVRFDERLFLYGSTFTTKGEEMLSQIGYQLEPWLGKIQIKVVGFTDSVESDKQNLPLERGTATVEYLINHTRLPVRIFTIVSGEGQASPFPAGSVGDPYRERTVMLEISLIED